MIKPLLFFGLMLSMLFSCESSTPGKRTDQENNEVIDKEGRSTKVLSTKNAVQQAEKQFDEYLPKILLANEAVLDIKESFTGDLTGDGIEDVVIYFTLMASTGANAIVGQGLALYKNYGNKVKVIAGFEPDYLFSFDKISDGNIYVEKIEYAENDARCCPSIKTSIKLKLVGNSVLEEI